MTRPNEPNMKTSFGAKFSDALKRLRGKPGRFSDSKHYWEQRYSRGGNSGEGSYGRLSMFKAKTLNAFVLEQDINTVIEFGCGDGNQLALSEYPRYMGYDVSPSAINLCRKRFAQDGTKAFHLLDEHESQTAELTLSLDVLYHLVEDSTFEDYMQRLFLSASRFVIIYSSNTDQLNSSSAPHVRHRKFTDWVEAHCPQWELAEHTPNAYPFEDDAKTGSFADFFTFSPKAQDKG